MGDIVHGMPIDEYHASAGISCSGLHDFVRSPLHYYALHRDPARPPREDKAGQLEGTLAHCAILEPGEFHRRYAVLPADAPRRPTEAQWNAKNPSPQSVEAMEWWRRWSDRSAGVVTISAEQNSVALRQAASVNALPEVAALLSRGHAEVSAFWIDDATGEPCRCRPDWVHPIDDKRVILMDVKTCGDASPADFLRQIARKGYHRQAPWYSDGYAVSAGVEVAAFVFAAVESAWPYAACAVMLDDDSLQQGRRENRALLDRYAECNRTNTWPGYSAAIELVSLPAWAISKEKSEWLLPA
jgi:hypothetical protein